MKALLLVLLISFSATAQDRVFMESGDTVSSVLIEINKDEVVYKNYNDPDFSTVKVPVKDVVKIEKDNGEQVTFDHSLTTSNMGLCFGSAFPTGAFKATEFSGDKNPGFARKGGFLDIFLNVFLYKNIGVGIKTGGYGAKFDRVGYKSLSSTFPDSLDIVGNYGGGYFMAGPIYSVKLAERIVLDNRLLFGRMSLSRPAFTYNYRIRDSINYSYTAEGGSGSSGAWTLESGIRANFGKRFAIRFTVAYTYAYIPVTSSVRSTNDIEINQQVSMLQVGFGLAYRFKRKIWHEE